MALPAGMSTCTVTWGSILTFFGDGVLIDLDITPQLGGNARSITWAATGQTLVAFTLNVKATAGTQASFVVPHVDQDGFVDGTGAAFKGWSYLAKAQVRSVGGSIVTLEKVFQVVVGQASVDLDTVPDGTIAAPSSAPLPAVTSVAGLTGSVSADALADALGGLGGGLDEDALVEYLEAHPVNLADVEGMLPIARMPAGGVLISTDHTTRPTSRTDIAVILLSATPATYTPGPLDTRFIPAS